jgi:hypothetical protein
MTPAARRRDVLLIARILAVGPFACLTICMIALLQKWFG